MNVGEKMEELLGKVMQLSRVLATYKFAVQAMSAVTNLDKPVKLLVFLHIPKRLGDQLVCSDQVIDLRRVG
jgi:hypothetical protein